MRQTVPLCAKDDGQLFLRLQRRVVNADGAVIQRHSGRFKAHRVQAVHALFGPVGGGVTQRGPWHLKHRTHADPHRTAAQRVAAGGRQQDGVYTERCGAAEDRADVRGVHDALQHGHPAGAAAQLLRPARCGAAHGAQHAPGQRVAGQRLQNAAVCGVDHSPGAAGQHPGGRAVDLPALHQKGERLTPGIQRRANDLGAFGDEDALFRLKLIAQLGFGQSGIYRQFGGV